MESKILNLKIIQDKKRETELYIFSEHDIINYTHLVQSHNDTLDMFLCAQPIIVVQDTQQTKAGYVSQWTQLIRIDTLRSPYDPFLVNSHAMKIIEGKTLEAKLAVLSEFGNTEEENLFLIDALYALEEKGLYVVSCLNKEKPNQQ